MTVIPGVWSEKIKSMRTGHLKSQDNYESQWEPEDQPKKERKEMGTEEL